MSTTSGFEKRKYPTFKGDILDYSEFRRLWLEEVAAERRPEAIELAALRDSLPQLARNKIVELRTLKDA